LLVRVRTVFSLNFWRMLSLICRFCDRITNFLLSSETNHMPSGAVGRSLPSHALTVEDPPRCVCFEHNSPRNRRQRAYGTHALCGSDRIPHKKSESFLPEPMSTYRRNFRR
jgi:hypothetical protein